MENLIITLNKPNRCCGSTTVIQELLLKRFNPEMTYIIISKNQRHSKTFIEEISYKCTIRGKNINHNLWKPYSYNNITMDRLRGYRNLVIILVDYSNMCKFDLHELTCIVKNSVIIIENDSTLI